MTVNERIVLPCFLCPEVRARAILTLNRLGYAVDPRTVNEVLIRMLSRSMEPVQSRLRRTEGEA